MDKTSELKAQIKALEQRVDNLSKMNGILKRLVLALAKKGSKEADIATGSTTMLH